MKNYLVGLVWVVLTSISVAASAALTNTPESAVPRNLHVYNDDGHTYVDHVSGECSTVRYRLEPSHKKYDAILSILLAAQTSKKRVTLRYDYSVGCTQGRIVGVYLVE